MREVLPCPKRHGQLDLEIGSEMRVPLATVRWLLAERAAAGEVGMCQLTRHEGGRTIEVPQRLAQEDAAAPATTPGA